MIHLAFLLLLGLLAAPAYATDNGMLWAGVANRQMPYDAIGTWPTRAYSFRRLRTAYTADKAVNIVRASDSAVLDVGFTLAGRFNVAVATAFCAATTCKVVTMYDQSGNAGDITQATDANRPTLVFGCFGTTPCMEFTAATMVLAAGSNFTPATGLASFSAVANRSAGTGTCRLISQNGAAGNSLRGNSANQWSVNGGTSGTVVKTATDAAWHTASGVVNGASSAIKVDQASEATGTATGSTTAATPQISGVASTTCQVVEAAFWDNYALTAAQRTYLNNNQRIELVLSGGAAGPAPLAIDGTPGHNSTSADSTTVTLSPRSGSVAFVCVTTNSATVSSVTSANLTWAMRAQLGGANNLEMWYAVAAADLTNQVITVNLSSSQFVTVDGWAVSGADTTTIFDTNGGLPVTGASTPLTISTTAADTFIFGCMRADAAAGTAGAGWTAIGTPADYQLAEYKIVSTAQTNLSVTRTTDASNGAIADAIRRGGSTPPPPPPNPATITSVTDDVAPTTGTLTSGSTTNDNNLTVRVSLTGTGAIADNTVRLYNGTGIGSQLGVLHTLTGTNISNAYADVQTGTLADATYIITARISNAGGQSAVSSNSFTETVSTGAVLAPAFYVATAGGGGNDSNSGTLASPFLTIARCQTAMQGDGTKKTCYIRAGNYGYTTNVSSCYGNPFAIRLTTADNGETLSYYPPDGYGSAFISGGGTVEGGICLAGSGITVTGLDIGGFTRFAISSENTDNTIENNTLHGTTLAASNGTLFMNGNIARNKARHNYVYNSANNGIVAQPSSAGAAVGVEITNNFVYNSTTICDDCGAIYTQYTTVSSGARPLIAYNYIRDISANVGYPGSKGIYLDDQADTWDVYGNAVQPGATGWACFHVHGGENNVISGNICDQRNSSDFRIVFYQTSATVMAGNDYKNNIAVTDTSSAGNGYTLDGSPTNKLDVSNNNYYGYGSATPSSTGSGAVGSADSAPANVNPNFTCGWDYTLPGGSPVFSAPTNFPAQPASWGTAGYWGPPGFTIPRTGTVPSPPHAC